MATTDPLIGKVRAAVANGDIAAAERMLRERLDTEPADSAARIEWARVLNFRGHFAEALGELDRVEPLADGATPEPLLRAALLGRLGQHEHAIACQRDAIDRDGEHPRPLLGLAHLLKTIGDMAGAAAACRRAISLDPNSGEAWWSLANLKTIAFDEADRSAMRAALVSPALTNEARIYLHFALARALDLNGEHEHSWHQLNAANGLRAAQMRHDPNSITTLVDATIAATTRDYFAARSGQGEDGPRPIFIIGMPRSGSTLVEQMLASHSLIEGTMELPDIGRLVREVGGTGRTVDSSYLARVAALDATQRRALGRLYLERTEIHRREGCPWFIDKMPNNWLFVGFIRLILPGAKIIDVRRHPLDCGLSNFRELYARGQAYSYDLDHIGRYYRDYVRLMDHFDAVQPGLIHRLVYDRLVDDTEAGLHAALAYLGLPFEKQTLRFDTTRRAVRTASAGQVRQPLNRAGLGQWQAYDAWLEPLRAALGTTLDIWDASLPR